MPEIEVHERPRAQQRARTGRGHHYTPSQTLEAQHWIRAAWIEAGFPCLEGPLVMEVVVYLPRPAGHYRVRALTDEDVLNTPCPRCGPPRGHLCRGGGGRFHRERRQLAKELHVPARELRPGMPWRPAGKPDMDNYAKLVMDALQGVAYRDDGQVDGCVRRRWADGRPAGWVISVEEDRCRG